MCACPCTEERDKISKEEIMKNVVLFVIGYLNSILCFFTPSLSSFCCCVLSRRSFCFHVLIHICCLLVRVPRFFLSLSIFLSLTHSLLSVPFPTLIPRQLP